MKDYGRLERHAEQKKRPKKLGLYWQWVCLLPSCAGVLTSCGDGRSESHGDSSSHPSSGSRADEPMPPTFQGAENIPLASDPLSAIVKKYSEQNHLTPLSLVLYSASVGHLPEKMGTVAEGLGLVGDLDVTTAPRMFDQLPAGFVWVNKNSGATTNSTQSPINLSDIAEESKQERLKEMNLSFDGIPVHGAQVKAMINQASGDTTYLSASVPRWLLQQRGSDIKTLPFALSVHEAKFYASNALNFSQQRFHSPLKIYVPRGHETLASAYQFTLSAELSIDGRGPAIPLEVAVSADTGEILWQRALAMHAVNGGAQLYVENKKTATAPSAVSLPNLQGDGSKLAHPLFDVFNCHEKAKGSSGEGCDQKSHNVTQGQYGQIEYSNEVYDELISYAAITKAMSWYNAIDQNPLRSSWDEGKWPGTRANFGLQEGAIGGPDVRLSIYVRTRTPVATTNQCGETTTPDNAQYLWSGTSGQGKPEILIGYGGYNGTFNSCYRLFELGKDMDVVMHEFGHHVVFRGLSNSGNQSVALHEGTADYFTYAISGNNLLAENSYPRYKALRQANISAGTSFKNFKAKPGGGYYSVTDMLAAPHMVGEFWSGILWEIRTTMGRNPSNTMSKFDKIVWDSIDLMKSDAGLFEGIVALSESAKRYGQRFGDDPEGLKKIVQDTFIKYGFAHMGTDGILAPAETLKEVSGTSPSGSEPKTTVSKSRKWGCGDVALASSAAGGTGSSTSRWLWLLLLVPALATRFLSGRDRTPSRIAVQVSKKVHRN